MYRSSQPLADDPCKMQGSPGNARAKCNAPMMHGRSVTISALPFSITDSRGDRSAAAASDALAPRAGQRHVRLTIDSTRVASKETVLRHLAVAQLCLVRQIGCTSRRRIGKAATRGLGAICNTGRTANAWMYLALHHTMRGSRSPRLSPRPQGVATTDTSAQRT